MLWNVFCLAVKEPKERTTDQLDTEFKTMKLTICSWLLVAVFVATLQTTDGRKHGPLKKDPLKKLGKAFERFHVQLFTKLIEADPTSNVVFSPGCIYGSLAMLYAGAGGETKNQLASVLNLDLFTDDDEFYQAMKAMEDMMISIQQNISMKGEGRLFAQDGFQSTDEFNQMLNDYFPIQMETLDFNGDPSGATSRINDWVSEITDNKIQELFPDGTITSDTHLVLAGAVAFSSLWKYKFDQKNTEQQTFTTYAKDQVQVPMMSLSSVAGLIYSKTPEFQMLSVPSAGGILATLFLILKKNATAINPQQRRRALQGAHAGTRSKLRRVTANLKLPKFDLSSTANVKDALQAMGITDLFDENAADLSAIDPDHSAPLSELMHKAYVSFNEDGQEIAWSTEELIRRPSKNSGKVIDFVVDRPFLFFVYLQKTGCIVFSGYIANPLQSN